MMAGFLMLGPKEMLWVVVLDLLLNGWDKSSVAIGVSWAFGQHKQLRKEVAVNGEGAHDHD